MNIRYLIKVCTTPILILHLLLHKFMQNIIILGLIFRPGGVQFWIELFA